MTAASAVHCDSGADNGAMALYQNGAAEVRPPGQDAHVTAGGVFAVRVD